MRIAVYSDIHGNREAFEACLADAAATGVDRSVILGDLVGYGADPAFVVDRTAELVAAGAIAIRGNHDDYAVRPGRGMSENARIAIEWTHRTLDATARGFLDALPLTAAEEDRLYVHASASNPPSWPYIDNRDAAADCLAATDARLICCGHTHVPALFHSIAGRRPSHFAPLANKAVPLSPARRHVLVLGAVGQPRDGNPAACWGLVDTEARTATLRRVPYDVEETQRKIIAAGLPQWLARRLAAGR